MPYYLFDPSALDPQNQSQPYCYTRRSSVVRWSDFRPVHVEECYRTIEEAKEAQRQCREYEFETVVVDFETHEEVKSEPESEPESETEVWVVSSARLKSRQAAIEFAERQGGEWYVGRATVKVSTQVKIEEV